MNFYPASGQPLKTHIKLFKKNSHIFKTPPVGLKLTGGKIKISYAHCRCYPMEDPYSCPTKIKSVFFSGLGLHS